MDRFNQSLNAHLLCYDPVFQAEGSVALKGRRTAGVVEADQPFRNEPGVRAREDGRADVSCYAPNAKEVTITYGIADGIRSTPDDFKEGGRGEWPMETMPLTKGDDGYWRGVIDPGPGQHDVFFAVDGVTIINHGAPYCYEDFGVRNFVNLPDDPCYELQDVPHGSLTRELFYSETTGRTRPCWVYTPPGYKDSQERYPVLYINHGGREGETSWFVSGKTDMILDNLIAAGLARPMIVVANSCYCYREMGPDQFVECSYTDVLCNDCIPFIDRNYRTIPHRESRAVAGLSRGGGQSRRVVFGRHDLFAWAGLFSSGEGFPVKNVDYDFTELFADRERFNALMKLIFVTCGDSDPRIDYTTEEANLWADKGYHVEMRAYRGRHEWNVWRASVRDFAKKLFR